jgi:parallel beta-helix repeat protein
LNNVQNGRIENCIIENGSLGIYISAGERNVISNNTLINCDLLVWVSSQCTFIENRFNNGGFIVAGFELDQWNTHNIDTSNKVNGKPIYYWKDLNFGNIPEGAGQVILVNCTNVTIENQELTNSSSGIMLGYSSHNLIKGNIIDSQSEGGIDFWVSSENTILENKISSCKMGIYFQHSDNNHIELNDIKSNMGDGIQLYSSNYNSVFRNKAYSNNGDGISIFTHYSSVDYGISIGNIITNNTVTNNNMNGITLEYSKSNSVTDNYAESNRYGFYLDNSAENNIENNIAMNNTFGIGIEDFSNETLFIGNNISSNYHGISIQFSYNNVLHHNNINNNSFQVNLDESTNSWDDDHGEGNYWSDYDGVDDGSDKRMAGDGVGDTNLPHLGVDYYPLMESKGPGDLHDIDGDKEINTFSEPWFICVVMISIIMIITIVIFLIMYRKYSKSSSESDDRINFNKPKND